LIVDARVDTREGARSVIIDRLLLAVVFSVPLLYRGIAHLPVSVLYLAIPAQNEVATIGVLLWRLRTVLAEFPREYEVVVYDDASTDETADVAEQYAHAMPVTVIRGKTPVGYAGAVDALVRYIAGHTRYPRRDAMLLLQGDFTDPPGIVPEFARRFEGGADLVVGERTAVVDAPKPVRRLFTLAGLVLKPFVRVDGVKDLTGSMRLVRISALRDLIRTAGNDLVCEGDTWTANADFLLRLLPHARRVESVPLEPTYGVRTRETRRVAMRDAVSTLRWGWRARGKQRKSTGTGEDTPETPGRPSRPAPGTRRREEPEVTAERLRERSRERSKLRGEPEASAQGDARTSRSRGSRNTEAREGRDTRRPERPSRPTDPAGARAPSSRDGGRDRNRERPRENPRDLQRDFEDDLFRDNAGGTARESIRASSTEAEKYVAPADATPRDAVSAKRGKNAPAVPNDDLLFDDPFAGPPRAGSSRPPVVVPPVFQPRDPANADASDADDGDDDGDADGVSNDEAFDDTTTNDATSGDTTSDESESGESAEVRERKRRRNRRSRRRKSKLRNKDRNAGADGELSETADGDTEETSADVAERPTTRSPREGKRKRPEAAQDDSDSDDPTDDDQADAAGEDEASADGTRPSRPRRRGRRGRRGGNRRSRGRGSDESGNADSATQDGAAGSDRGTGNEGPPSAD
jgi:hypothetical protein